MKSYEEPFLEERMKEAQERAKKIAHGSLTSEDDLQEFFKIQLSRRYGLPLYDTYFDNRTLDQLAFEVFVQKEFDIKEAGGNSQLAEDKLVETPVEEREDMFADLIDESDFAQRWAEAQQPGEPDNE